MSKTPAETLRPVPAGVFSLPRHRHSSCRPTGLPRTKPAPPILCPNPALVPPAFLSQCCFCPRPAWDRLRFQRPGRRNAASAFCPWPAQIPPFLSRPFSTPRKSTEQMDFHPGGNPLHKLISIPAEIVELRRPLILDIIQSSKETAQRNSTEIKHRNTQLKIIQISRRRRKKWQTG